MDIELYTHWVCTDCTMIQLLIQHIGGDVALREICVFPTDENVEDRSKANINGRAMGRIQFFANKSRFAVPLLVIDRKKIITDTKAILKYFVERYCEDDSLYPTDKRDEVDKSFDFVVDVLGKLFSEIYYSTVVRREDKDPDEVEALDKALTEVELLFAEHSFICGDSLTVVDFCLAVITSALTAVNYDLTNFPKTTSHLSKCETLISGWDECAAFRANRFGHWYRVSIEAIECGGCPYLPKRPAAAVDRTVPVSPDIQLYSSSLQPKSMIIQISARLLGIELSVKNVDLCHKEENEERRKEADENWLTMLDYLYFSDNEDADAPPILIDDGSVTVETQSILEHMLEKRGTTAITEQLYPSDSTVRNSVNTWLGKDLNVLDRLVLETYVHSFENAWTKREIDQDKVIEIKNYLKKLEENLEENDFITGQSLTIADVAYAVTLSFLQVFDPDIFDEFGKVSLYLRTCKELIEHWDDVCGPGLKLLEDWYGDLVNWTQNECCPLFND